MSAHADTVITASNAGQLEFFRAGTDTADPLLESTRSVAAHAAGTVVTDLALDPSGRSVASVGEDGRVCVTEIESGHSKQIGTSCLCRLVLPRGGSLALTLTLAYARAGYCSVRSVLGVCGGVYGLLNTPHRLRRRYPLAVCSASGDHQPAQSLTVYGRWDLSSSSSRPVATWQETPTNPAPVLTISPHPARPEEAATGSENGVLATWDMRVPNWPTSRYVMRERQFACG